MIGKGRSRGRRGGVRVVVGIVTVKWRSRGGSSRHDRKGLH